MSEQTAEDRQIEQWKVKRLVKMLDAARGNGTSAITLILNSKQDINLTNKMLTEEYGTASCIKSRVNRLSVLSAITSTQQRLKKYNRTPPNGLIIFCGEVLTEAWAGCKTQRKPVLWLLLRALCRATVCTNVHLGVHSCSWHAFL